MKFEFTEEEYQALIYVTEMAIGILDEQMSGAPTRELATLCNTLTDTLNKLKGISNGKEDIRKAT